MDLSVFYEEFQQTYTLAVIAVCMAALATGFIGYRTVKGIGACENEKKWEKPVCLMLLLAILGVTVYRFIVGAVPMKQDIDQQTILYYAGDFEVTEAGYDDWSSERRMTVRIDGQDVDLLFVDEEEEFTEWQTGHYTGELVYAKHAEQVLFLKGTASM